MSTRFQVVFKNDDALVETLEDRVRGVTEDYFLLIRRTASRIVLRMGQHEVSAEELKGIVTNEVMRSFCRNLGHTPLLPLTCTRHRAGLRDYVNSGAEQMTLADLALFVFRLDVEETLIRSYGSRYTVILEYNRGESERLVS